MSKAIAEAHKGENMKAELAKATKETGIEAYEPVPVGTLLQAMITKGITGEAVGAVEQLVKLQERMEDRRAEKEYSVAFVALQGEMPSVQATKVVPNRDGTARYKFAPFDEIMRQVGPLLQKHGFTVTFSTDYTQGPPPRLVQHCTLQHVSGHKRTNSFAVRVGGGPPGASETQADGAANTYAKRYALINALNITVGAELDDDARADGDEISQDKAEYLRQRCAEVKADVPKFLKFAQAQSFETIREAMYPELVKLLDKKADERIPV